MQMGNRVMPVSIGTTGSHHSQPKAAISLKDKNGFGCSLPMRFK